VQRAEGLAARPAQVGLHPPAEAAVGVAVRGQRGEHALGGAVAEQQVEAATVEQAGMRRHEGVGAVDVDHESDLPPPAARRLERFGRSRLPRQVRARDTRRTIEMFQEEGPSDDPESHPLRVRRRP
jgi:hypothetical protein